VCGGSGDTGGCPQVRAGGTLLAVECCALMGDPEAIG
jgi:hypothetical protein